MASTTLLTFLLRTPRNVTSVQLVGSWDNFHKPYPMKKDANLGGGHWRGCHSFTGIICDGDSFQAMEEKRDGGLLMGGRYWYFYQLDDDIEYHDPTQPSTTSCPFLPGQMVNILDVPFQIATDEEAPTGRPLSYPSSMRYTMDPEDKYRTPKPPSPTSRRSISASHEEDEACTDNGKASFTAPTMNKSQLFIREAYLNLPTGLPPNFKGGRPYSEPIQARFPLRPTSNQLHRVRSAGHTHTREFLSQDFSGVVISCMPSRDSEAQDASSESLEVCSMHHLDIGPPINDGLIEPSLHMNSTDLTQIPTKDCSATVQSFDLDPTNVPCNQVLLDFDLNDMEQVYIKAEQSMDKMLIKFEDLNPMEDCLGAKDEGKESREITTDVPPDRRDLCREDETFSYSKVDDVEFGSPRGAFNGLVNVAAPQDSSSASSARTSGFFSSLSSAGHVGCMTPSRSSQPPTPTTSEPGEFIRETAYATQRTCTEDHIHCETKSQGLIGYSLPEAEHASVLTLRNLETVTTRSTQGDLEMKSKKQIVQAWNDGSEHHKTALQELVDDLGYLGAIIA